MFVPMDSELDHLGNIILVVQKVVELCVEHLLEVCQECLGRGLLLVHICMECLGREPWGAGLHGALGQARNLGKKLVASDLNCLESQQLKMAGHILATKGGLKEVALVGEHTFGKGEGHRPILPSTSWDAANPLESTPKTIKLNDL